MARFTGDHHPPHRLKGSATPAVGVTFAAGRETGCERMGKAGGERESANRPLI